MHVDTLLYVHLDILACISLRILVCILVQYCNTDNSLIILTNDICSHHVHTFPSIQNFSNIELMLNTFVWEILS